MSLTARMCMHCARIIAFCVIIGFQSNAIVIKQELGVKEQTRSNPGSCEACNEELTGYQKEVRLQRKELDILEKEMNSLKLELSAVKKSMHDADKPGDGVSYIRWGRNSCPASASRVYKGYVGGTYYGNKGGGSNYLCLPDHPQWGNTKDGFQYSSKIYGTEYETFDAETIFFKTNNNGKSVHNLEAVCVLCFVPTRSTQIMIPAKRECPVGWTMEYRGYLATEQVTHGRNQFICLDEEPEGNGSYTNVDGALLYAVESVCGPLPCPPYVQGWELACIVCTK